MSNGSQVGIVMGSDSDWPVMKAAAEALAEFDVAHEADVVSAHRMPDEMLDYGRAAADRGLQVIIAGAGGAAHLPGMLAAVTPLPVIGVPVPLKNLDGMDSLLSIVQMPAGVPGRDRGDRERPQRRPARRTHPGRGATPTCGPGWSTFQAELREKARAKGEAVRGSTSVAPGRVLTDRTAGRPGRLVGLDVARCLALVGMIATHTLMPPFPGEDRPVWHWLASGRASALFAVLAGVSLALMSGGPRPVRGRERLATTTGLAVRALLIAALGLRAG